MASCASDKNKSNSKSYSSIKEYIQSKESATTSETFPFAFLKETTLPSFSAINEDKGFSFQKVIGNYAYLVNNEKFKVLKYNLQSEQSTETFSFPEVSSILSAKPSSCVVLNENQFLWHNDSTILLICNSLGQIENSIQLPLVFNNKNFQISSNPKSAIQFESQSKTLVFPIQCAEDYNSKDEYTLPKFASYNLKTSKTEFIPISLPLNYSDEFYLPLLYDAATCMEGQTFYALFPLSSEVYSYDLLSKQLSKISIQIPVNLTDAQTLTQPTDPRQIMEIVHKCSHLSGFSVIKGIFYIQQTGAFSDNLESKKFTDNSLLCSYNSSGSLIWGGQMPIQTFDNKIFNLTNASNSALNFTSYYALKSEKGDERYLSSFNPEF